MRDSVVTRVLRAPIADVRALLTPVAVVRYEGSHLPKAVSRENGRFVVTAWPNGRPLEPKYVVETDGDRVRYRRETIGRPFVAVETTIELAERPDGTRIRLRSVVDPAVSVPFLGRFVAWRRRRTLEGFCDRLAADLARPRSGE